jgi:hypothetical protein
MPIYGLSSWDSSREAKMFLKIKLKLKIKSQSAEEAIIGKHFR